MKRIETVFQTEIDIMAFMEQLQTVFGDTYFNELKFKDSNVSVQVSRIVNSFEKSDVPEDRKSVKVTSVGIKSLLSSSTPGSQTRLWLVLNSPTSKL